MLQDAEEVARPAVHLGGDRGGERRDDVPRAVRVGDVDDPDLGGHLVGVELDAGRRHHHHPVLLEPVGQLLQRPHLAAGLGRERPVGVPAEAVAVEVGVGAAGAEVVRLAPGRVEGLFSRVGTGGEHEGGDELEKVR